MVQSAWTIRLLREIELNEHPGLKFLIFVENTGNGFTQHRDADELSIAFANYVKDVLMGMRKN